MAILVRYRRWASRPADSSRASRDENSFCCFVDLQGWPASQREAKAVRLASEQAQQSFDLKQGPLLKPLLLKLHANAYRLTIIAHQSIIDGISAYRSFLPSLQHCMRPFPPETLRRFQNCQYSTVTLRIGSAGGFGMKYANNK